MFLHAQFAVSVDLIIVQLIASDLLMRTLITNLLGLVYTEKAQENGILSRSSCLWYAYAV